MRLLQGTIISHLRCWCFFFSNHLMWDNKNVVQQHCAQRCCSRCICHERLREGRSDWGVHWCSLSCQIRYAVFTVPFLIHTVTHSCFFCMPPPPSGETPSFFGFPERAIVYKAQPLERFAGLSLYLVGSKNCPSTYINEVREETVFDSTNSDFFEILALRRSTIPTTV